MTKPVAVFPPLELKVLDVGPASYSVARNRRQVVVANNTSLGELFISSGSDGKFEPARPYDKGKSPSIAINNHGVIVEVHNSESIFSENLHYNVGTINSTGQISFSGGEQFDGGIQSCISINDNNVVVEVHRSGSDNSTLYYRVGYAHSSSISFGKSTDYDSGNSPTVSINANNHVIMSHKGGTHSFRLYYRVGIVDPSSKTINLGDSIDYEEGIDPQIIILDDNTVIEIHGSQNDTKLYYKTGTLDVVNKRINWIDANAMLLSEGSKPRLTSYEDKLSLLYNIKNKMLICSGETFTKNWMTDDFKTHPHLTLAQLSLPGSHDADMYRISERVLGSECNCLTQTKDLYSQLNEGVRFLDIRPVYKLKRFYIGHFSPIHTGVVGAFSDTMENALKQIAKFAENSSDLIILRFSNYLNFETSIFEFTNEQKIALMTQVETALWKFLYKTDSKVIANIADIEIGKILDFKKAKIIATFSDIEEIPSRREIGLYSYGNSTVEKNVDFRMFDQYTKTEDVAWLKNNQIEKMNRLANRNVDTMFLLSWNLTQDDGTAIACELSLARSVLDLAEEAAPVLHTTMESLLKDGRISEKNLPNVVHVDAFQGWVTVVCRQINDKIKKLNENIESSIVSLPGEH